MTITVCPAAMMGAGKCKKSQCRLRHDVVYCKPCKCLVLRGDLRKHRRGEDHRLKSGIEEWSADVGQPALATLPSAHPRVPKSEASEKGAPKLARKEEVAGTGGVPARDEEAEHILVSGQEGFDFKSEVGVGKDKKTNSTVPVIIEKAKKTPDGFGLTLVGLEVTGAGSKG
ncbi:hypothetical protein EI94DRAFT_1728933 [Lactarius quietus]|nr:hypothetical protein EI94DRAFT_1728933 [Lactarius quietus]